MFRVTWFHSVCCVCSIKSPPAPCNCSKIDCKEGIRTNQIGKNNPRFQLLLSRCAVADNLCFLKVQNTSLIPVCCSPTRSSAGRLVCEQQNMIREAINELSTYPPGSQPLFLHPPPSPFLGRRRVLLCCLVCATATALRIL